MVRLGGVFSNSSFLESLRISPEEFHEIIEELERWEAQLRALPPLPDDVEGNESGDAVKRREPSAPKGGPS